MKKLSALLTLTLILGACSNSTKEPDTPPKEETKESSLEIVSKVFEIKEETSSSGTKSAVIYLDEEPTENKFMYTIEISESEKGMAEAIGLANGDLSFSYQDPETVYGSFILDKDVLIYGTNGTTVDDLKEKMNSILTEKGLTIDQLKEAMKEFSEK